MDDEKSKRSGRLRTAALALSIPVSLTAGPILGYFIGSALDTKFNSDSIFTAIAFMLGFAAGVVETIKIIGMIGKGKV